MFIWLWNWTKDYDSITMNLRAPWISYQYEGSMHAITISSMPGLMSWVEFQNAITTSRVPNLFNILDPQKVWYCHGSRFLCLVPRRYPFPSNFHSNMFESPKIYLVNVIAIAKTSPCNFYSNISVRTHIYTLQWF